MMFGGGFYGVTINKFSVSFNVDPTTLVQRHKPTKQLRPNLNLLRHNLQCVPTLIISSVSLFSIIRIKEKNLDN